MGTRRMALFAVVGALGAVVALPATATAFDHEVKTDESTLTFTPDYLGVSAGETVRWDFNATANTGNAITIPHDVRIYDDPLAAPIATSPLFLPGSPPTPPPGYYEYTFTTVGTYSFLCSIHPGTMTGEVQVAPPSTSLRLAVKPKSTAARAGRKKAITATATNIGAAPATAVKVCAKAPKKRVSIKGKACANLGALAPAAKGQRKFTFTPTKKARGRSVKVTFTVTATNAERKTATATLRVAK